MKEPLAHSPRGSSPAQSYRKHICNVRRAAICNAERAAAYFAGDSDEFTRAIEAAAIYHDLGKLDRDNQDVLSRKSRAPLPIAHEDAGCEELSKLGWREATVMVAGHHAGLFSHSEETGKRSKAFRNRSVAEHVDKRLADYLAKHLAAGSPVLSATSARQLHRCGVTRRVALSCLVDADHSDTARHYGTEVRLDLSQRRWAERLQALDGYIAGLPGGETEREQERNDLRGRMYEACRNTSVSPAIRACDAPVGSGKTTAVMAHLLRVAKAKQLRHIFVVLPYTNIIKQSVDVYRDALVLEGECPEEVVAEHHHQADFEDLSLRQVATLWRAPIVVTTAVQFFETLGSDHPARLRKLHELPGSAVFVDETHAVLPSDLWPQTWRWLETWTGEWGGHLVVASGSLPRFWELREFTDPPKQEEDVPDLLSHSLRIELARAEKQRIKPRRHPDPFDCAGLIKQISESPGPRLVVLNTVQSAAVVADQMRRGGHDVLHLSTALAPVHRERIVERIKERLDYGTQDWTLVATSCVEAGMNFSFRTGFRESSSTASLIQLGGRVSRSSEHAKAEVWDFRTRDDRLNANPGFEVPRRVLDRFFDECAFKKMPPSDLAKEAMRRELTAGDMDRADELLQAEQEMEYPKVAELCRVIRADTRTVIVDPKVADALRRAEKVSPTELQRRSVQMWAHKIEKLAVSPLFEGCRKDSLYVWGGPYDPDFLGYMAGVLPLVYSKEEALVI